MNSRELMLRSLEIVQKIGFATPKTDTTSDIFCAGLAEHADVVV